MAGYTNLDYRKDLGILKELNIKLVMEFVENYRSNCKNHVSLKNPIPNSLLPFKR